MSRTCCRQSSRQDNQLINDESKNEELKDCVSTQKIVKICENVCEDSKFEWLSLFVLSKLFRPGHSQFISMSSSQSAALEMLARTNEALQTQTEAVETGSHYSPKDIPADWDPNVGQYIPCPKCLKPVQGIFSYLRQMAGGDNPGDAGLVKLTCSSAMSPGSAPRNLLECKEGVRAAWYPQLEDKSTWVILDFLDKRVIVEGYAVMGWGERYTIGTWTLFGRNDDTDIYSWTTLHHPADRYPLRQKSGAVYFDTQPNTRKMFRYLKVDFFLPDRNGRVYMPAFEIFGSLVILKDPPKDETAS